MPVQRRNVLEVTSLPWMDTIRIEAVSDQRNEYRMWLSVEQARELRHRLDDVLDPLIPRWHGPFGHFLEVYDVDGKKRRLLVTNQGMFPAEEG